MIELPLDVKFDLKKIIKVKTNKNDYIIDIILNEIKKYNPNFKSYLLNDAVIKTVETRKTKILDNHNRKKNTKKVIRYYHMRDKEKLYILKEVITTIKFYEKLKYKNLYILEDKDLINEGYLYEDGKINEYNKIIKKLILNKN